MCSSQSSPTRSPHTTDSVSHCPDSRVASLSLLERDTRVWDRDWPHESAHAGSNPAPVTFQDRRRKGSSNGGTVTETLVLSVSLCSGVETRTHSCNEIVGCLGQAWRPTLKGTHTLLNRPCSSAGQSVGFLNRKSPVRSRARSFGNRCCSALSGITLCAIQHCHERQVIPSLGDSDIGECLTASVRTAQ